MTGRRILATCSNKVATLPTVSRSTVCLYDLPAVTSFRRRTMMMMVMMKMTMSKMVMIKMMMKVMMTTMMMKMRNDSNKVQVQEKPLQNSSSDRVSDR